MAVDAAAVLDQKIAVGLIENPCRDALVALGEQVPAGECVVEIGSFKGRSTGHLALAVGRGGNGVKVHAIDPWEDRSDYTAEYLATAKTVVDYAKSETREAFERHIESTGAADYVVTHQALGEDVGNAWDGPKVGLLFHDGDHTEGAVFADLKAWLPHMAAKSVIVLHDVGDPRYGVEGGAARAFTRTKKLRETWDWEGREVHIWPRQPDRRGFLIVRTR